MSDESTTTPDMVELTRRLIGAFNRGDVEAIGSLGTEDAIMQAKALGIGFEGEAEVLAFVADWLGSFEDLAFELQETHDLGHGVVFAVIDQSGTPHGTVGIVRQREAWVIVWAAGLIVQLSSYTDIDEARVAADRLAEERG